MKLAYRAALLSAIAAGVLAAPAGAASAAADPGFGQHVRDCAQTMGLSGDHNPGMHHGNAGWDGMTCTDEGTAA